MQLLTTVQSTASQFLSSFISHIGRYLYERTIDALTSLYRYGPWWLGCWNFVAQEDVCAALASSAQLGSGFWLSHLIECDELIRERVKSHALGVLVLLVVFNGAWVYLLATYYLFCVRFRREPVYMERLPRVKDS